MPEHVHNHDRGHLTLEERHEHEAETYDELAKLFLEQWGEEEYLLDRTTPPFPNKEHVSFLGHALDQIRPLEGKRILEAGTGTGNLLVWFAMNGAEVVGNDVSAGVMEVARKRASMNGVLGEVDFVHQPIESLDHPDGSFDVVFGNVVAHHFDVGRAGRNIYRLLKPGGAAVFSEPILFAPEWVSRLRTSSAVTRLFPDVKHSPDERAFSRRMVAEFSEPFDSVDLRYFQIFGRVQNFAQVSDDTWARIERVDTWLLERAPWLYPISRWVVMTMRKAG